MLTILKRDRTKIRVTTRVLESRLMIPGFCCNLEVPECVVFELLKIPFLHHSLIIGSISCLAKAQTAVRIRDWESNLEPFLWKVQTHSLEDFGKPLAIFSLQVMFHVSTWYQRFLSLLSLSLFPNNPFSTKK